MGGLSVLLQYRWQIVRNLLRHVRRYVWVHVMAALGLVVLLVGGGTLFFLVIFDFLVRLDVFGPLLLDRLLAMIFLAFFLMLVFSNLVITLSINYISREVEFLLSFPVRYRSIFWLKFCESLLFSSWAFAVLSLPLFIAFGWVRGVGWQFFPVALALLVPFLLLPAGLGSMLTLLISALLPARKGRIFKLRGIKTPRPQGGGSGGKARVSDPDFVSRVVIRIGKAANVKVDVRTKRDRKTGERKQVVKYASAHDLRRSFGERWALRVMPQVLQELMRHESIETTLRYYVGKNAQRTADALWDAYERVAGGSVGNKCGNTRQDSASDRGSGNDASPWDTRAC